METVDYLGVQLDICPTCAGVWFDDGELRELAAAAPSALKALDSRHVPELEVLNVPGTRKMCPRCQVHLRTYSYRYNSPVLVDSCPQCSGIFIEDQELEAIYELREEEARQQVSAVIASRKVNTGATNIGSLSLERSVSTLLHALHHWRDRQGQSGNPESGPAAERSS